MRIVFVAVLGSWISACGGISSAVDRSAAGSGSSPPFPSAGEGGLAGIAGICVGARAGDGAHAPGGFGGAAGHGAVAGDGGASVGGNCILPESDWLQQARTPEPDWILNRPWATVTRIGFAGGRLFVAGQTDPGSVGLELSTIDGSGETERLLPVPDGEIRDLVARDDGLYVAGETLTVAGETWSQDAAIAKYDLTTTNPIWSFVVGGPWGNERVSSITVGDAGVVYAAGQFNSDATADGMPLVTVGGLDFFLARLVEGVPEWVHTWGSPDNDGDGPRVALMPDGGVVAVSHLGFPQNQLDFRRFTSSGELLWNRVLPIGASLFAVGVGAGGAITAGGTFSGVVLDLEPLGGPRLCSLGEFTAFVIGLDDDGRHVWSRAFASPIGGGSNVIRLLSHGDQVVVTGYVGMTDSNAERADYGYVRCFDSQGNPGGTFVLTNHPYADLALGDSGELFAGATQRFAGPSAPAPLHVWALPAISE